MDESPPKQQAEKSKEGIIARQVEEAARMLGETQKTSTHVDSMYGSGLSLMGFICVSIFGLIAPLGLTFWVGSQLPNLLAFVILAFSIGIAIIAGFCYLYLSHARSANEAVIALFAFSLVAALEVWVPLGGILTMIAAYVIMSHNGWLQG